MKASHCALPSDRLGFGDDGILLNGDGVVLGETIETTLDRIDVALPGHCCLEGLELRRSSVGGVGIGGVIEGRLRSADIVKVGFQYWVLLMIGAKQIRMCSSTGR